MDALAKLARSDSIVLQGRYDHMLHSYLTLAQAPSSSYSRDSVFLIALSGYFSAGP